MFKLSFWLRALNVLPSPIHRLILRAGHEVRYYYHRWFDIVQSGCCMICLDRNGHVLLVRHSFVPGSIWQMPGGAIDRDRTPVEAAQRELMEEVGCSLSEAHVFEFEQIEEWGCRYETWMVSGVCDGEPVPDGREVTEARFFDPKDLPPDICEITERRIARWGQLSRLEARRQAPLRVVPPIGKTKRGRA